MKNRYLAAFKESGNILGLAAAAAISAATLNPIPLVVGIALELVYLAFVPDMKWYEARLSKLHEGEILQRRNQIKQQSLPLLRPEMQQRFARLEHVRDEIARQNSSDATWFQEILRKLDFLLEKFLQFSGKEAQFRLYLMSVQEEVRRDASGSASARASAQQPLRRMQRVDPQRADTRGARQTDPRQLDPRTQTNGRRAPNNPASLADRLANAPAPVAVPPTADVNDAWTQSTIAEIQAHYDRELNGIRKLCETEQDAGTKAVLEKRVEVLQRRREFIGKMGRILTNLHHQLNLLEDTFGLISDEIRARPPEQVLADIEDVVSQTNSMTQALEEMAPYEQMLKRIAA